VLSFVTQLMVKLSVEKSCFVLGVSRLTLPGKRRKFFSTSPADGLDEPLV
jgi:hypothetical protein